MLVQQAFRFELDPTASQCVRLARHAGAARFAWNWALEDRIKRYRQCTGRARFANAIEQHRQLNALKKVSLPWMYDVSKCAPQEALRDLDRAFRNFARARSKGRRRGFPRFKRKGQHDAFRLSGAIRVQRRTVQLPRLGSIRTKEETTKFRGRVLSATVKRDANRWYVSLTVDAERPDPAAVLGPIAGIDLGLHSFAVIADGASDEIERVEAPKPLARHMARLQRRSRSHHRKRRGSCSRRRSAMRLAQLHRRIRNIRQDFLHKLTSRLARTKSVIVIEDLHVHGLMRNERLARGIADAGWGTFRRMLSYKTAWYGSRLVIAPRFLPSSKACSRCRHVVATLPVYARVWTCPDCGATHDRDVNAARNLARWYDALPGVPREVTPAESPLTQRRPKASAGPGSPKQESVAEDAIRG